MLVTHSRRFALVAAAFAWAFGSSAEASSFNFKITGHDIKLGKVDEFEPIPIHVKAVVGKPFTLVAQGRAYPRPTSAKDLKAIEGIPCEPEAGKWIFDAKIFKVGEIDKKSFDKTQIAIRLEPTVVGSTRIRFVGKVGGYDREFDIRVEVTADKQKK